MACFPSRASPMTSSSRSAASTSQRHLRTVTESSTTRTRPLERLNRDFADSQDGVERKGHSTVGRLDHHKARRPPLLRAEQGRRVDGGHGSTSNDGEAAYEVW